MVDWTVNEKVEQNIESTYVKRVVLERNDKLKNSKALDDLLNLTCPAGKRITFNVHVICASIEDIEDEDELELEATAVSKLKSK